MRSDPTVYIYAAALIGAALGFMGCAVLTGRRVRRANLEGYLEAVRFQKNAEKNGL